MARAAAVLLFVFLTACHAADGPARRFVIGDPPATAAISPDGKYVAAAEGGRVFVWSVATGKQTAKLAGPALLYRLAFSADGKSLLAAGDRDLRLWDHTAGKVVHALGGRDDTFVDAAFAPDGLTFAAAQRTFSSADVVRKYPNWEYLRVFDRQTAKVRAECLVSETAMPNGLSYAPNSLSLALGFGNNGVYLFDATSGKNIRTMKTGPLLRIQSSTYAEDGRSLVSMDENGTFRVWELATGGQRLAVLAHPFPPSGGRTAIFTRDARLIISAGNGTVVKAWDAETGKEWKSVKGPRGTVVQLVELPNGSVVALTIDTVSARLWDVCGPKDRPKRIAAVRNSKEVDAAWAGLADEDATKAYTAMAGLLSSQGLALRLFQERLRPVTEVAGAERKKAEGWLADLASENGEAVERASEALVRLGARAAGLVEAELKRAKEEIIRERLRFVQAEVRRAERSPEVRLLRSLEVVERIGGVEAVKLLRSLAGGMAEAAVTREAKRALRNLGR